MTILFGVAGGLIVGYLPGALIYRLSIGDRRKRGLLAAEERAFWHVVISVVWSLSLVLAMAAAGVYRYDRLIAANVIVSLACVATARGGLSWRGTATKVTIAALVPLVVLGVGIWRFFPASEYIVGGKDPGIYVNEGIAIDRTGQLFRHDPAIAAVPEASRDLFFPRAASDQLHYGLRFMGVFLNDPATGEVIAGWPHLYPASVAIGYRLAGTVGATNMVALWATFGVLAVYFFGARLIGRLAAFFAAIVLALNVIEVWFGRYPTTEVVMQALLFAALLALARAHQDEDPFFGGVAGSVSALLIFLRFDVFFAIAGMGGALALVWIVQGRAPRLGFVVPVLAGTGLGLAYYAGPMKQYFMMYDWNLPPLPALAGLAAAGLVVVLGLGRLRRYFAPAMTTYLPIVLAATLVVLAVYALFLRQPVIGVLASWDAFALRTFRDSYVLWPAFIAALAGYALVARREFWRDPAFFVVFAGFAVFFFYKVRVVPEHFWMARRFLPVILPGALILASGAVFGSSTPEFRRTVRRGLAASAFMAFIGWQYAVAARPVAAHVEYKGAIRQIARLAQQFTARDLVIVESRDSGDYHVLALPLAYEHGLPVLVLASPRPDRRQFEAFLTDALTKYERVFFIGGGGTDLLSRRTTAAPTAFVPFEVPEYETTNWDSYPRAARMKKLGYSIFQLGVGERPRAGFSLDVGYQDVLNVVRLHGREVTEGRTFRWTQDQSFIAATDLTGVEREMELVLHDGGRPAGAPPATVEVFFNDISLGRIAVDFGFKAYRLAIPADVLRAAAANDDPAQLRLISSVWRPADFGGGTDTRELGVMLDRIEIH